MGWYRCSCGFITEARPRFGNSIVSVSHLHRASRLDGTSSIARMEEIPDPALECATPRAAATRTTQEALLLVSAGSVGSRPALTTRPERPAA
jgi:hypothetical protein